MDIFELANTAYSEAAEARLAFTEEYFYRKVCRFYSTTFHTPLEEVFKLDPYMVLRTYYEESIDKADLDVPEHVQEILDRIYSIEDPDYNADKEEEIQEFIDLVEKGKIEKVVKKTKGFAKPEPTKKTLSESEPPKQENLPPGGFVNFDYLNKMEEEKGGEF